LRAGHDGAADVHRRGGGIGQMARDEFGPFGGFAAVIGTCSSW
jgi:hypothetical protein